jgi:hypothetical protein
VAPACAQGEHRSPDPGSYTPARQPTANSNAAAINRKLRRCPGNPDEAEIYQAGQSFYGAPGQAPSLAVSGPLPRPTRPALKGPGRRGAFRDLCDCGACCPRTLAGWQAVTTAPLVSPELRVSQRPVLMHAAGQAGYGRDDAFTCDESGLPEAWPLPPGPLARPEARGRVAGRPPVIRQPGPGDPAWPDLTTHLSSRLGLRCGIWQKSVDDGTTREHDFKIRYIPRGQ